MLNTDLLEEDNRVFCYNCKLTVTPIFRMVDNELIIFCPVCGEVINE